MPVSTIEFEKGALELELAQILGKLEGAEKCLDEKRKLEEETSSLKRRIDDIVLKNRKTEELNEAIRRARTELKAAQAKFQVNATRRRLRMICPCFTD